MADRLYPLTFHPLFKSMLWGGRRLPAFLGRPAPHKARVEGRAQIGNQVQAPQGTFGKGGVRV